MKIHSSCSTLLVIYLSSLLIAIRACVLSPAMPSTYDLMDRHLDHGQMKAIVNRLKNFKALDKYRIGLIPVYDDPSLKLTSDHVNSLGSTAPSTQGTTSSGMMSSTSITFSTTTRTTTTATPGVTITSVNSSKPRVDETPGKTKSFLQDEEVNTNLSELKFLMASLLKHKPSLTSLLKQLVTQTESSTTIEVTTSSSDNPGKQSTLSTEPISDAHMKLDINSDHSKSYSSVFISNQSRESVNNKLDSTTTTTTTSSPISVIISPVQWPEIISHFDDVKVIVSPNVSTSPSSDSTSEEDITDSPSLLAFKAHTSHPIYWRTTTTSNTNEDDGTTILFHEPRSRTKLAKSNSGRRGNKSGHNGRNCPEDKRISPCKCFNNTIQCFVQDVNMLNKRLQYLAKVNDQGDMMHFETLEIRDSRIKKLSDIKFNGLTFTTIRIINCSQLSCVAYDAFKEIAMYVKVFYAVNTGFSSAQRECNVLNAVRNLKNLEELTIKNSYITEIESNVLERLERLTKFDMSSGGLTRVHGYAFERLPALSFINLSSNKISRVEDLAFCIRQPSEHGLVIDLSKNLLNVHSFDRHSLESIGRDAYIKVSHNKHIDYLKEKTFFDFLLDGEANNYLEMTGIKLKCIGLNAWILDNKAVLMDKIVGLKQDFWDQEADQCED